MKKSLIFLLIIGVCSITALLFIKNNNIALQTNLANLTSENYDPYSEEGAISDVVNALSIESLKEKKFEGSDLVIEETLPSGSNYSRYIVSYESEGNKIYALLTVPNAQKPENGYPVIIFNHGYIPPAQYRTTERYIAYTDAFSRNGYIVFRSDYRGHGDSEGEASGGYGSNAYTIDVLNGLASVKKYKDADESKIGMWGHSMGGFITLRSMVVDKSIKAGVIWGGVVVSYPDLLSKWRRGTGSPSPFPTRSNRGGWRNTFIQNYGTPEDNPEFWKSISSNSYLSDISGPLQLHHGQSDSSVPVEFSEILSEELKSLGKEVEFYTYPSDDHDITANFSTAISRSVEFFDLHVKN